MEINYGLVAIKRIDEDNVEVLHFCGYENEPSQSDIEDLKRELETDLELGLVGRRDYLIEVATPEMVEYYNKMIDHI